MSTETLKEMEDRWLVLMAATDPKSGERIYARDLKYAREVTALRVQIEDRKAAEPARPQISEQQLKQLAWLDRAMYATDKNGKRRYQEMTPQGTTFRKNITNLRQSVLNGQPLPASVVENTERDFAEKGITMPDSAPGLQLAAPATVQSINTSRGPK